MVPTTNNKYIPNSSQCGGCVDRVKSKSAHGHTSFSVMIAYPSPVDLVVRNCPQYAASMAARQKVRHYNERVWRDSFLHRNMISLSMVTSTRNQGGKSTHIIIYMSGRWSVCTHSHDNLWLIKSAWNVQRHGWSNACKPKTLVLPNTLSTQANNRCRPCQSGLGTRVGASHPRGGVQPKLGTYNPS